MNIIDLKEHLYTITKMFFQDANVIWSETIATRPKLPFITLKLKNVTRNLFPCENDNGGRVYNSNIILEVNLYTKGKEIQVNGSGIINHINTATSDMLEFVNFLQSDGITDYFAKNYLSLLPMGSVIDLTGIENDSQYMYRAMCEFTISFVEKAQGRYAIGNLTLVPNSSGGGSLNLQEDNEVIKQVELTNIDNGEEEIIGENNSGENNDSGNTENNSGENTEENNGDGTESDVTENSNGNNENDIS